MSDFQFSIKFHTGNSREVCWVKYRECPRLVITLDLWINFPVLTDNKGFFNLYTMGLFNIALNIEGPK